MPRIRLIKRRSFQVMLGLLGLTLILFTLLAATPFTPGLEGNQGGLDPRIQKIMNESIYQHGEWGLLETDPTTGHTIQSLAPAQRLFVQGSTTKIFTVSAALDDLGFNHLFTTPLYALGQTSGGSLNGTLVWSPRVISPWEAALRPMAQWPSPILIMVMRVTLYRG